MFRSATFIPVALAAAVGVPYVVTNSSQLKDRVVGSSAEKSDKDTEYHAIDTQRHIAEAALSLGDAVGTPWGIEGPAVMGFDEVFRFDVTPSWVLSRWPRVTTRLAALELQGYRVPLVTGTREDDVAGALTYYFDSDQKLQRFTFYGTTGDSRRLVADLVQRFELQYQPNDDAGLYLYQRKWSGKVKAELRVRPADVVHAASPRTRFHVALAIDRPRDIDKPESFGTRKKDKTVVAPTAVNPETPHPGGFAAPANPAQDQPSGGWSFLSSWNPFKPAPNTSQTPPAYPTAPTAPMTPGMYPSAPATTAAPGTYPMTPMSPTTPNAPFSSPTAGTYPTTSYGGGAVGANPTYPVAPYSSPSVGSTAPTLAPTNGTTAGAPLLPPTAGTQTVQGGGWLRGMWTWLHGRLPPAEAQQPHQPVGAAVVP